MPDSKSPYNSKWSKRMIATFMKNTPSKRNKAKISGSISARSQINQDNMQQDPSYNKMSRAISLEKALKRTWKV